MVCAYRATEIKSLMAPYLAFILPLLIHVLCSGVTPLTSEELHLIYTRVFERRIRPCKFVYYSRSWVCWLPLKLQSSAGTSLLTVRFWLCGRVVKGVCVASDFSFHLHVVVHFTLSLLISVFSGLQSPAHRHSCSEQSPGAVLPAQFYWAWHLP